MVDLVVRGGQVVAPWGVGEWDVAVQGEKIVAVAEPGALPSDAGRVVDATGKIVVPGGIEPHAQHSGAYNGATWAGDGSARPGEPSGCFLVAPRR